METGFVHTVYFWTKEDLSEEDVLSFHEGVRKLSQIDLIQMGMIGPPAQTPREVVDNTYNYAITFVFANKEDHDAYQDHPDHHIFINDHKEKWARVQVYDHLPA